MVKEESDLSCEKLSVDELCESDSIESFPSFTSWTNLYCNDSNICSELNDNLKNDLINKRSRAGFIKLRRENIQPKCPPSIKDKRKYFKDFDNEHVDPMIDEFDTIHAVIYLNSNKKNELNKVDPPNLPPKLNKYLRNATVNNQSDKNNQSAVSRSMFGSTIAREQYIKEPFYRTEVMATNYIAFAESKLKVPHCWVTDNIDKILAEGICLYKLSSKVDYKSQRNPFNIIEELEDKKVTIHIDHLIENKYDHPVNLLQTIGLVSIYNSNFIFQTNTIAILIMKKNENDYFVFDANGRTADCLRAKKGTGKSSILTVKGLEGLVNIILDKTVKQYDNALLSPYNIYKINFGQTSFATIEYKMNTKEKVSKKISTVNKFFKVLPALRTKEFNAEEQQILYKSLLVIAVCTLYSTLHEKGYNWERYKLDNIIDYGTEKSIDLKEQLKADIDMNNLPEIIDAFSQLLKLNKDSYSRVGFLVKDISFHDSTIIRALFVHLKKHDTLIVQLDELYFAIWKDEKYFYVFDPIQRDPIGMPLVSVDENTVLYSSLQMHSTFDSLARNFYKKVSEVSTDGLYFLHNVTFERFSDDYVDSEPITFNEKQIPELDTPPPEEELLKAGSIQSIPAELIQPEFEPNEIPEEVLKTVITDPVEKNFLESHNLRSKEYELDQEEFLTEIENQKPQISSIEKLQNNDSSNSTNLVNDKAVTQGTVPISNNKIKYTALDGAATAIAAIILSRITKLKKWDQKNVNYATNVGKKILAQYSKKYNLLAALSCNAIPDIRFCNNSYETNIRYLTKGTSGSPNTIKDHLGLEKILLFLSPSYSCAVIQEKKYYYVYSAFPSNQDGERIFEIGPSALIKFRNIDDVAELINHNMTISGGKNVYAVYGITIGKQSLIEEIAELTGVQKADSDDGDYDEDDDEYYNYGDTGRPIDLHCVDPKPGAFIHDDDPVSGRSNRKSTLTRKLKPRATINEFANRRKLLYDNEDDIEKAIENANRKALENKRNTISHHDIDLKHISGTTNYTNKRVTAMVISDSSTRHLENNENPDPNIKKKANKKKNRTFGGFSGEIKYTDGYNTDDESFQIYNTSKITNKHSIATKSVPTKLKEQNQKKSNNFKYEIIGTIGLLERYDNDCLNSPFRASYYASIYAIHKIILKPLPEWNSKDIDDTIRQCIITNIIEQDRNISMYQYFENIQINEYLLNIEIKPVTNFVFNGKKFDESIIWMTKRAKCFLIQVNNRIYSIYFKKNYDINIFDPFGKNINKKLKEHDSSDSNYNDMENLEKDKYNTMLSYKNYACWIQFKSILEMITYMMKQANCLDISTLKYNFFLLNVKNLINANNYKSSNKPKDVN